MVDQVASTNSQPCTSCNFINDDTISCENENIISDMEFHNAINEMADRDKKVDIRLFHYVVKQKNTIIADLREQIKIIEKTNGNQTAVCNNPKNNSSAISSSSSDINNEQVTAAVLKTATRTKCQELTNLVQDDKIATPLDMTKSGGSHNEWVVKKRRSPLGVPKTATLHIHFPEVMCEALTSRNPTVHSSFKVTILEENFRKAMDAGKWPHHACVRHFFYRSKKETPKG